MIKVVIFDYDGTLLNTFSGVNRFSSLAKILCFKYLKRCYLLLEVLETCLGIRWPLHAPGIACISHIRESVRIGIATGRSELGLIRSAHRSGMNLRLMDFIHVRSSISDAWGAPDQHVLVLRSHGRKETPQGLASIMRWLTAHGISPSEVLFVGDDETDRQAAAIHSFGFVMVDRYCPNFGLVYRLIVQETSEAPGI